MFFIFTLILKFLFLYLTSICIAISFVLRVVVAIVVSCVNSDNSLKKNIT